MGENFPKSLFPALGIYVRYFSIIGYYTSALFCASAATLALAYISSFFCVFAPCKLLTVVRSDMFAEYKEV